MVGSGSRIYMYSAATGDAQTYMKIMDYEKEMGMDDLYPPHITAYTASDSADKQNPDRNLGGRPKKSNADMTDSGLATRNNGGNKMKKLSTK